MLTKLKDTIEKIYNLSNKNMNWEGLKIRRLDIQKI